MAALLAELAKKLAERWLSLLVLPGALFLAVLVAARELGHARWYDVQQLVGDADRTAAELQTSAAGVAMLLLAFLLAAAACGVVAQALGSLLEQLWMAADWPEWPTPFRQLARRRVVRRDRAYRGRREEVGRILALEHSREQQPSTRTGSELDVALRKLFSLATEPPNRPTWMGDRVDGVAVRLRRDLEVDLPVVWPPLWLYLPESTRAEVMDAREAVSRAAALGGWGVLYLTVGALWWPGFLIAAAVTVTAWRRARASVDGYATLIEAAVRLHAPLLARQIGVRFEDGQFTRRAGAALTVYLTQGEGQP